MKKMKTENKRLKLNTDLNGYKAGQVIVIKCKNGVPIEKYWRDRVKDSTTDQCVEVLTNRPQPSSSDKITEKPEDNLKPKGKV